MRDRLQQVFRDVFDDDELEIHDAMTAAEVPDWDSLQHVNLIVAVEAEFGVRFATAEISGLKADGQNVGTFQALIEQKVRARSGS